MMEPARGGGALVASAWSFGMGRGIHVAPTPLPSWKSF